MDKQGQVIRLNAGNDTNGNPRRVFVYIESGLIADAWDEGYRGEGALPEWARGLYAGATFEVSAREYRRTLKAEGGAS